MECFKSEIIFVRGKKYKGFTFIEILSSLILISVLCVFFGFPILSELSQARLDETVKYASLISNASESHRKSVSQVSCEIPKNDDLKSIYRGGFIFSSQYRDLSANVLDWNDPSTFSLSYLYSTSFSPNSFLDKKSDFYVRQTNFFSVVYFNVSSQSEGLERYTKSLQNSVHDPQSKILMVPSQYTTSPYLLSLSQQYIYKTHSHWQEFRL